MSGRERIHHRRAAIHYALLHLIAALRRFDYRRGLRGIGRTEHLADDLAVAPRLVATQAKLYEAVPYARLSGRLRLSNTRDKGGHHQDAE